MIGYLEVPMPTTPNPTPALCSQIANKTADFVGVAAKVFAFVKERGKQGATADEAHRALNIRLNSVSATMAKLGKQGHIFNSRTCRRTSTGRPAIVWTVTEP